MMIYLFWGLVAVFVIGLVGSIKRVPAGMVYVVDRMGKFVAHPAGFRVFLPVIDRKIGKYPAPGREISILLWDDNPEVVIDFNDGGRVILKQPKIWLKMIGRSQKHPVVLALEAAEDFERSLKNLLEDRLSAYFNALDVEDIFDIRKKDLLDSLKQRDSEGKISSLESLLGIELSRITLDDFNFSANVEETRKKIYIEKKQIEIEESRKKVRAIQAEAERDYTEKEFKAVIDTAKEIVAQNSDVSWREAINAAKEMYHSKIGSFKEFKGLDGGITGIAAQLELGRQLLGNQESEQAKQKKEKSSSSSSESYLVETKTGKKI